MHFVDPESLRAAAATVFARERARVLAAVPAAEVEHIGATSIPGAWSKGDVDLLVRVPRAGFAAAVEALRGLYAEHQLENWCATFASFAAADGPVGAQLVVADGPDDVAFRRFRDRLAAEPELLREYNALKLAYEGAAEEDYRAAKGAFVRRVVN